MSKFKVGDKVRAVVSDVDYGLLCGSVYTVTSVHSWGNICLTDTDEASKLGNSVNTLKTWGDNVVDSVNKNANVSVNGKQENAVNVAD